MARVSEQSNPPVEFTQSLWQMFEDGVNIDPEAPLMTACHQAADHYLNLLPAGSKDRPHSCLIWTYKELRHASLVAAKAMIDLGVKRGSTIIAPIPNGIETHLVRIVSWILQLTLVVLDADLVDAGRHDELAFFIKTMSPALVVITDDKGAEAVAHAAQEIDYKLDFIIRTQASKALPSHSWAQMDSSKYGNDSLEALASGQQRDLDQDGSRVAVVLFTSGTTTGRPKGCPHTVRNVVSACMNEMWLAELPKSFAIHNPHSRAVYNCFGTMGLAFGRHLIQTHSHFVPEKMFEAIKKHKAEGVMIVPAPLKIMAAQHHIDWSQLTSLRSIYIGGDVIDTELFSKAQAMFPHARIMSVWGMSEGTGMIGLRDLDITPPLRTYHGIITIGKAGRSARIRIADTNGRVLPRGVEGELTISGPSMIDHYIENVQPELFYTDSRGSWIRSGDKAVMDEDGYIYITGRLKDIIKQSGINISPFVLEATLNKHDDIDSAILGVPHPIKGEQPVAVVLGSITERRRSSIKGIISDSLGKDFALKEVYSIEELGMKDWPFSAQGKVQKFKLKDEIIKLEQEKLVQTYCHHGGVFYPWFV